VHGNHKTANRPTWVQLFGGGNPAHGEALIKVVYPVSEVRYQPDIKFDSSALQFDGTVRRLWQDFGLLPPNLLIDISKTTDDNKPIVISIFRETTYS
jgi:hypothetical protein